MDFFAKKVSNTTPSGKTFVKLGVIIPTNGTIVNLKHKSLFVFRSLSVILKIELEN